MSFSTALISKQFSAEADQTLLTKLAGLLDALPQFVYLMTDYMDIKQIIFNLRVSGHYGPKAFEQFVRPSGYSAAVNPLFPQDAAASLLERLFPSCVGLVVNSSQSDKINQYLKPDNIIEIFKIIHAADYHQLSTEQKNAAIRKALLPANIKRNIDLAVSRGFVYTPTRDFVNSWNYITELAQLIDRAFTENHGVNAKVNGYPNDIVEMILWSYMWERHSWVVGPRTTLAIIKSAGQDNKQSSSDATMPVLSYGMSCIQVAGNKKYYSDCGDTMLRNTFIRFYQQLEVLKSRGMNINPQLLTYLGLLHKHMDLADAEWVRYDWTQLVSNLNKPDEIYKVRYLLPEGRGAFYAIDVGLVNLFRVIGKLLGDPPGFDMEMKDKSSLHVNLDFLCDVLSTDINNDPSILVLRDRWTYKVVVESDDNIEFDSLRPDHDTGFIIIFLKNGCKEFEWYIERQHFDFHEQFRHSDRYMDEEELSRSVIGSISGLLTLDMRSPEEKVVALFQMSMALKYFKIDIIHHFLSRWLDTSGQYFYHWNDQSVNRDIVEILLMILTDQEITELNIPKLSLALKDYHHSKQVHLYDTQQTNTKVSISIFPKIKTELKDTTIDPSDLSPRL